MRTFVLAALGTVALSKKVDWSSSYADLETTTLSQCPPGTWRKAGVVSGQNCFACLPGTFAELVNQDSCTKCQAGRFSKKFQATSRVVCQQCPKGSYWPMTGARAQHVGGSDDCRDIGGNVCAYGTADCTDQRVCTTCEAGRYQSKEGERSCIDCEPGTYREQEGGTGEMSCTRCDMGTFDFVKVGPNNDQYVYGATKLVETCEFRPVDCKLTVFGEYSRCNRNCGGGTQTKTRAEISGAEHGGAACETLKVERACNTHPCSDLGDRFPKDEELKNGLWWQMKFNKDDNGAVLGAGMTAECRYQKDEATGPNRWELLQTVENVEVHENGSSGVVNHPVVGFCCRATGKDGSAIGKTWCYSGSKANTVNFWGTKMTYSDATGQMCDSGSNCASFKPIIVHKRKCKEMTCKVEEHDCTAYKCPESSDHMKQSNLGRGWCPNKGHKNCINGQKHTSLRVTHSNNEEQGGHYCMITNKAKSTCECFCLDTYQTLADKHEIVVPHFNEDVQKHGKRWLQ